MFTLRLLKIKIHSRRVFVFKRLLPVFAFLLASVMIAWPALNEHKDKFALATPSQQMLKNNSTDMESVRFFSKDHDQNPISVTASAVREMDSARQIIRLDDPTARYVMSDGVVLTGETVSGLAFQKEKYLYFENQVDARTDTGYQAVSEKVVCDYNAGSIGSEQDVFVKGPSGMLKANGFFLNDNGNYLHFKGHTATLLFHEEKSLEAVETLDFEKQKSYLDENKENIYVTSENGLIIQQTDQTITALKNVDVYQDKNHLETQTLILNYAKNEAGKTQLSRLTAIENVILTTPKNRATANQLTVYRNPTEIQTVLKQLPVGSEVEKSAAPAQVIVLEGNAKLKEGENIIRANKIYALYDETESNLVQAVAVGTMSATNGRQRIQGNYGIYTPNTKIVRVYEKVSLHEKESVLKGEYATLNLKTGISSLSAPKTGTKSSGGRVKGQIIPRDFEASKAREVK